MVHKRRSGNQCYPSRPARVDGAKRDSPSVQQEGQSRKEEREAVHTYLGPPYRLGGREGGSLLLSRSTRPGTHRPLCTNGVVESDQAAEQEEEAEVLGEVNGGPDVAVSVLHKDSRIVHGVFPGGMEVLRNQDHDNAEGHRHRSYAGSDGGIPSDLPSRGFSCVHRRPLCARARPAYYTPLVAGTPPRIGSGTYLANLRGWMAEVTEVPRIGNSGS